MTDFRRLHLSKTILTSARGEAPTNDRVFSAYAGDSGILVMLDINPDVRFAEDLVRATSGDVIYTRVARTAEAVNAFGRLIDSKVGRDFLNEVSTMPGLQWSKESPREYVSYQWNDESLSIRSTDEALSPDRSKSVSARAIYAIAVMDACVLLAQHKDVSLWRSFDRIVKRYENILSQMPA